jgi:hypothetical protein
MMQIDKPNHAQVRMQQRGVNSLMVEALSIYGDKNHHHKDRAIRLTFTKHGLEKFRKDLKTINAKLEKMKSLLVVEDGGSLITLEFQLNYINK